MYVALFREHMFVTVINICYHHINSEVINLNYNLSKRQQQILDYIKSEFNKKGYPPTVRDICDGVNLSSPSTVHGHLNTLVKKGYLRKDPTKPRCIEVVEHNINISSSNTCPKKDIVHVPILVKVTSREPILATENIEDTFPVPSTFLDNCNTYFMLSIKGSSILNAEIMDGDYVLVKQQNTASNNDIVVAMIDDKATVKRFYNEENHIHLKPENSSIDPIVANDVSHVSILGLVKGIFRKL